MSRWRAAFYSPSVADKTDKTDKTLCPSTYGAGFGSIGGFVTGDMARDGQASGRPSRPVVGADGADPHPPGARLLVRHLWPRGIAVEAVNGAVVLCRYPDRQRIPPALVAACRRHLPALAAWVGAPNGARLVVEVTP